MNKQFMDVDACPLPDIAAYIDCELAADDELELEHHLVDCGICTRELNRQKDLVRALNCSLQNDIELPVNFTRNIVANAESRVSGLRRRSEWMNAAFVICALLFFVLFSLGADAGRTFGAFFNVFERLAAVGGFAAHVIYDLTIGGVVILRSIGSQVHIGGAAGFLLFGLVTASAVGFSRIILRNCRI
jgi:anti-sigma factor RsiW